MSASAFYLVLFFSLTAAALATELFYYLFYFSRIYQTRHPSGLAPAMKLPPVSVVICVRNESANLRELLPALLRQAYPDFEICLVADRSGPETLELLRNFAFENSNIRLTEITENPPGISPKKHALAIGIESASHEILVLSDADCLPAGKNWLRYMVANYDAQTDIVLGLSPYQKENGWLNLLIQYDTMLTAAQFAGMALAGKAYMGLGRNLSYRKSLFRSESGFGSHEKVLSGDDDLFINRAARQGRVKICLHPDSFTFSAPVRSFGDWLRQKHRHFSAGGYYRLADQLRLGIFHLSRSIGWAGLILLCLLPGGFFPAICLLAIRTGWLLYAGHRISLRSGNKIPTHWLPILDFLHCICVFAIGIKARFYPPKEWK